MKTIFGVDVIAPSVAEDVEAHTSMEMEGRSESCATTLEKSGTDNGEQSDLHNEISFVVIDNASLEHDSEDGLMQEDTKLTKVGGSSADEPVIDSNDMDFSLGVYPVFRRQWRYPLDSKELPYILLMEYSDNLVIEAVGGETASTASKQDMDKYAYVCHNMPHHKARLKVTEDQLNTFGDNVSPRRNARAQKECDRMRFLIELNNDDIGVTQLLTHHHTTTTTTMQVMYQMVVGVQVLLGTRVE
ncbi:hypothetical protein Tco_0152649 [Tanacetum coccineum]